ncbi:MAG: hypothetical protein H6933_00220 [Burkholderiaceae bacterium]|nr:hypothetical protein [Burkholderiaceae bacterium]
MTAPDYVNESLALLQAFAERAPLPRVKALHLPPPPPPGGMRGEFCALELDDGSLGLSYVLLGDTWAQLTAHAAGHLQPGDNALAVAQGYASGDTLVRTIGFAAVNALTRCLCTRAGFTPPVSRDSLGQLDPQPGETIGMVGHFTPLLPRLRAAGAKVVILELRADLVGERDGVRVTLDPAELRSCRKVLATGTLLLNHTLEPVLAQCVHADRLVLVGPSVGGPPDPLFARGITLLGGSWVEEPLRFLDTLRAGEPAGGSVRKVALAQADWPGWAMLLGRL